MENRALLAGNVTVGAVVSGVLTINLDTHSNHVTVNENGGSAVTVSGTTGTSINGLPLGTSVMRSKVTSIVISVGGTAQNSPVICLTETTGAVSGIKNISVNVSGEASGNAPGVTLTATGVVNTGTFSLTDNPGGTLWVNVTNSQFSSLSINQTGCCPASVDLEGDHILGAVSVTEGVGNGDKILVDQNPGAVSTFGSTTFVQGAGPAMTGCYGSCDTVLVDDANLKDL